MFSRILVAIVGLIVLTHSFSAQDLGKPIKETACFDTIPRLQGIAISNNNKLIALASAPGGIQIWSIGDQAHKCTIKGNVFPLCRMQFIKEDTDLVAAGYYTVDGRDVAKACRWDTATGKLTNEIILKDALGGLKSLSQNGRYVITLPTLKSRIATVWDLATKKNSTGIRGVVFCLLHLSSK